MDCLCPGSPGRRVGFFFRMWRKMLRCYKSPKILVEHMWNNEPKKPRQSRGAAREGAYCVRGGSAGSACRRKWRQEVL